MADHGDARDVRYQLGWRNGLRRVWEKSRVILLIGAVGYLSYQCGKSEGMESAMQAQYSALESIVSKYDGK